MRRIVAASAACFFAATAAWAECPGHPNALGIARTITIDPVAHARLGTMQYAETLPLEEKEVVLTFDDGPLPPYSSRILDILAAECAKATFFIVGRQARAFPDLVRRAYDEGHTIATHSENHPFRFDKLPFDQASEEIEEGIASTAAALGSEKAVAPFFRIPGLRRSVATENYLAGRGVALWSADFPADDWRHITAKQVMQRALDRLERKGKGVLLLHDIQPATALALPGLLQTLKTRGYRIVHVVPFGADRPKTVTEPQQGVVHASSKRAWPRIVETTRPADLPVASPQSFGWPGLFQAKSLVATKLVRLKLTRRPGYQSVQIVETHWPGSLPAHPAEASASALPVPSLQSFGIPHPYGPHIALPVADEGAPQSTAANQAGAAGLSSVAMP
jgi:peptidoglycan/xylan/chitin deacetylase (PgdA/CDA1 family)